MTGWRELLELQNPDGGWGYRAGASWTEPTCYALLALAAVDRAGAEPARRAARWLAGRQRPDGGWAPRDGVSESTWVTALTLLLPRSASGLPRSASGDDSLLARASAARAAEWLLAQTGRESGWVYRLRMRLLGVHLNDPGFDGWPWYPGTAAWVAPTALSILALRKMELQTEPRPPGSGSGPAPVRERIEQGRRFLLARRCRDGGWNHGSTRALGYDSGSYPETTGMALLALHDSNAPEAAAAEGVAQRHLAACKSPEAASWLRLALFARGHKPPDFTLPDHNGTLELALATLAGAAAEGRNLFLQ
jgi:Squalene-hopene cyclase C-terminal domain/Prenyltransferase and squalene oxidase repeat